MANDLDTEIAEKWEEAIDLAYAIEDSFNRQAEVLREYTMGPMALQNILHRLATRSGRFTLDDAFTEASEFGYLESLDFSHLRKVADCTSDLFRLLRELEELEGERG